MEEIETVIKELKKEKSPGIDGLHNELLVNFGPKVIKFLRKLF